MAFPAATRPSPIRFAADDDVRAAGCETLVDLLRFRAETSPAASLEPEPTDPEPLFSPAASVEVLALPALA